MKLNSSNAAVDIVAISSRVFFMHHCFAIREKISRSIGRQLAAGHLLALPRAWDQDREQYGYTWDKRRWCSQWIEQKHFPLWVQTFQRFPRPNGLVLGATKGHDSSQKLSDAVHSWQFGPLINRPHRSPWSHVFMSWVPWVGVSWKLSFSSPNTLVIGVLLPGGPFLPPPFEGTSMAPLGASHGWQADGVWLKMGDALAGEPFGFWTSKLWTTWTCNKKWWFQRFPLCFAPFFLGGGMFLQFDSSAYFSKRVGEKTPSSLSKPSPDLPWPFFTAGWCFCRGLKDSSRFCRGKLTY